MLFPPLRIPNDSIVLAPVLLPQLIFYALCIVQLPHSCAVGGGMPPL